MFQEKELRGLRPNFHINLSVTDLYIYSHVRPAYFLAAEQAERTYEYINAHSNMIVGTGTEAAQFLSWKYLFRIFGIVSLHCGLQCLFFQIIFFHLFP